MAKHRDRSDRTHDNRPLFDFNGTNAGALAAAALGGALIGFLANVGRKVAVQAVTTGGNLQWDEALKAEHQATLAFFDKLEATDEDQTHKRTMLLTQIKHALTKHAIEEEDVIYPKMRSEDAADDADDLNAEHGYVKTYLFKLEQMAKDDPQWIIEVREFRALLEKHMREEENEVFPKLRSRLSEEENKQLSMAMHKEGLMAA